MSTKGLASITTNGREQQRLWPEEDDQYNQDLSNKESFSVRRLATDDDDQHHVARSLSSPNMSGALSTSPSSSGFIGAFELNPRTVNAIKHFSPPMAPSANPSLGPAPLSLSSASTGAILPVMHPLYKTELCRSWLETGTCRYGSKCQFAHGEADLRPIPRHPKYKTEICKAFHTTGTCPYGTRCRFIHTKERDNEEWLLDDIANELLDACVPPSPTAVEREVKKPQNAWSDAIKAYTEHLLDQRRLPVFRTIFDERDAMIPPPNFEKEQ